MSEPRPKLGAPERLPEPELAQLAVDVAEGRVYATNNPETVRLSFGLLIAGVDWDDVAEQIGAFYESMDKALPRAINGMPMFTSMKVLHSDDVNPLLAKIQEYEAARTAFVEGAA